MSSQGICGRVWQVIWVVAVIEVMRALQGHRISCHVISSLLIFLLSFLLPLFFLYISSLALQIASSAVREAETTVCSKFVPQDAGHQQETLTVSVASPEGAIENNLKVRRESA